MTLGCQTSSTRCFKTLQCLHTQGHVVHKERTAHPTTQCNIPENTDPQTANSYTTCIFCPICGSQVHELATNKNDEEFWVLTAVKLNNEVSLRGRVVPNIPNNCSAFIFQVKQINLFFPHFAILPLHYIPNYS
jgi:hypothetical protein